MPAEAGPLLEQLRRDADAAVAARTADARTEAERIMSAAQTRCDRRRALAVADRARALERQREAARANAAQSAAADVFVARAAFLDRVFAETERRLNAFATAPDLAPRLAPLIAEAVPFVPPEELRARCAEASRDAVLSALAAAGCPETSVVVDDAVPAGAMLENRTGTMRVDATFVARLRRVRRTLSIEAVRLAEGASS